MFQYLKRKLELKRAKTRFQEYGYSLRTFQLPKEGKVDFYVWDNPLESEKQVTQELVDFFRKLAGEGSLMIDIGAHIGDTTVPMALAAGKTGLVIAFDPNPHIFKVLEQNARINTDKTNIVALPYAITDEPGEFYYASSEASHNNGGVSREKNNYNGKFQLKETVKGINLADYLSEHHADQAAKLRFIKMDTEGFDRQILLSIRGLVEARRPIIVAECFKKYSPEERYEMFDYFATLAYKTFNVDHMDTNAALTLIENREDMKRWPHFDILAIPQEEAEEIRGRFS